MESLCCLLFEKILGVKKDALVILMIKYYLLCLPDKIELIKSSILELKEIRVLQGVDTHVF
jgi:hypothetical protein